MVIALIKKRDPEELSLNTINNMFALLAISETNKLMLIIKLKEIIRQRFCFCLSNQDRIRHKVAAFNKAIHNINNEDRAR